MPLHRSSRRRLVELPPEGENPTHSLHESKRFKLHSLLFVYPADPHKKVKRRPQYTSLRSLLCEKRNIFLLNWKFNGDKSKICCISITGLQSKISYWYGVSRKLKKATNTTKRASQRIEERGGERMNVVESNNCYMTLWNTFRNETALTSFSLFRIVRLRSRPLSHFKYCLSLVFNQQLPGLLLIFATWTKFVSCPSICLNANISSLFHQCLLFLDFARCVLFRHFVSWFRFGQRQQRFEWQFLNVDNFEIVHRTFHYRRKFYF